MSIPTPTHILVIDEIPLISVGLREAFRSVHPDIRVEYTGNVFHALSAKPFGKVNWYLIVLGSGEDAPPASLLLPAAELKEKFPASLIMIYSDRFDPAFIPKLESRAINALVHKHEGADEIVRAWRHLTAGTAYWSPKFLQ
jgi:DNA-binding NarL/FixJ family response regulator